MSNKKKRDRFRPDFPLKFNTSEFFQLKNKIIGLGVKRSLAKLGGAALGDDLSKKLKKDLLRTELTLVELSNKYNVGVDVIETTIQMLKNQGFNIQFADDRAYISKLIPKNNTPHTIAHNEVRDTYTYRFGAIGDNHLGSNYERLDVLNACYDWFEKRGVTTVFNTGNWIDGEMRFNKFDIHKRGMDQQLRYMLEVYPKRKGIVTKYVAGDDHEGWYQKSFGIDIGKALWRMSQDPDEEFARDDLEFLGYMERDIHITAPEGSTVIRVQHPGGGSSYATSYAPQKIVESLQGGEKPHILLLGHYHKASYNLIRNVHVIQTACTTDQTPFMRKLKIAAHLGGWVFEFSTDKYGAVTRFQSEYLPFFDKDLYEKRWKYKLG